MLGRAFLLNRAAGSSSSSSSIPPHSSLLLQLFSRGLGAEVHIGRRLREGEEPGDRPRRGALTIGQRSLHFRLWLF